MKTPQATRGVGVACNNPLGPAHRLECSHSLFWRAWGFDGADKLRPELIDPHSKKHSFRGVVVKITADAFANYNIERLVETGSHADVRIVCSDGEVFAHKLVLTASCSMFHDAFVALDERFEEDMHVVFDKYTIVELREFLCVVYGLKRAGISEETRTMLETCGFFLLEGSENKFVEQKQKKFVPRSCLTDSRESSRRRTDANSHCCCHLQFAYWLLSINSSWQNQERRFTSLEWTSLALLSAGRLSWASARSAPPNASWLASF